MAKVVGRREVASIALCPSGELLKAAAVVNEPLRALLPGGLVPAPKGVYRFRTLAEANQQQEAWLAQSMARRRASRA